MKRRGIAPPECRLRVDSLPGGLRLPGYWRAIVVLLVWANVVSRARRQGIEIGADKSARGIEIGEDIDRIERRCRGEQIAQPEPRRRIGNRLNQ